MDRLLRLFVFIFCWLLLSTVMTGCFRRVNLPSSPVYPVWSSIHRVFRLHPKEKLVVQMLQSKNSALWEQISLAWGIRAPYGRVLFRVEVKDGLLRTCVLRRSDLHASVLPLTAQNFLRRKRAKHLHTMFFRRYKALPVRYGICVYLRRLKWPKDKQPIVVNYVLKKTKSETKGKDF